MTRYILAGLATSAIFALPAMAETRAYDLDGFDRISVSSGIHVRVNAGRDQSVSVEQEDGNFEDIEFVVENGKLEIRRVKNHNWSRARTPYEVTINVPVVTELKASSGAEIEAENVDSDFFEIRTSSGAEINATGRCGQWDVKGSSGASINARNLQCERVDGSVSSGARVDAYASATVDGSASSGGTLRVFGGATDVDVRKSAGGSVQVRN